MWIVWTIVAVYALVGGFILLSGTTNEPEKHRASVLVSGLSDVLPDSCEIVVWLLCMMIWPVLLILDKILYKALYLPRDSDWSPKV